MRVQLGKFARAAIAACSDGDVEAGVKAALGRYAAVRQLESMPHPPRGFDEVSLGAHVVLVHLADLDRRGAEVLSTPPRS